MDAVIIGIVDVVDVLGKQIFSAKEFKREVARLDYERRERNFDS